MGLWDAGKVEGVTPAIILAVCEQARKDHTFERDDLLPSDDLSYYPPVDIPAEDMPINELVELDPTAAGDGAFDRVSYAKAHDEIFKAPNGSRWQVLNYHGKPWTLQDVDHPEIQVWTIPEKEIADWIIASNGLHPNPYVARIEVTYSSRGARAGYGIRKDGTFDCWYD